MSGVDWQEPPDGARVIGKRAGKLADFARELRANVGRWASVPDGGQERSAAAAQGLAQNIRRGKVKGFEQGTFDAAVLGPDVWARCTDARTSETADLTPEPVPVAPSLARDDDPVDPGDDDERVPESAEVAEQTSRDAHVSDVRIQRLSADVRAWAKANGRQIGDVGRIPADVFDAYFAATGVPDPRPRVIR